MSVETAPLAQEETERMAIPHWKPATTISRREKMLLKRLTRTRKLFAFLRVHRKELFDTAFQEELAVMYRDTGSGKVPVAPAQLAMAALLQAYTGTSDAEAVELTVVDARWQMVLDVLGAEEPAFSQGALQAFRERLIAHDMDRRLLERTVELARTTGAFDHRKLPKHLRVPSILGRSWAPAASKIRSICSDMQLVSCCGALRNRPSRP